MHGFEGRIGHKNGPDCFPPDRVRGPGLEELTFGDGQLLFGIVSGQQIEIYDRVTRQDT